MDSSPLARADSGRSAGAIGAVENALKLLLMFQDGRQIRVGEASSSLNLSRSTIHRLLNTLALHGFVEQDPVTRAYLPGAALTAVGISVAQHGNSGIMGRALVELARVTNETVHLGVLRGDLVYYLDSIESEQSVRTRSRAGWTLPAHATAAGKALLSELSDAEVAAIYPSEVIPRAFGRESVRRIDLLAELELVRARGYATNDGESEPDVTAVGVVLRDHLGRATAAISVTAPRSRGDDVWMREVGKQALAVSTAFSRASK